MYSPLEYAYLLYMAAHGGKAGGKQPIYWGAQAGTGTGGVGGVSGGSSVTVSARILPNGGVNTNGDNIKEKTLIRNDDGSITTIITDKKDVVTVTTTPANGTGNNGEAVSLPKNGGTVYIPTQAQANTEVKYLRTQVDYGTEGHPSRAVVQTTTTIRFSDGSSMVIRDSDRYYDGERSPGSVQFLGADDAYIERIRLEDSNRVERERFELVDAIRDGRMRVVQTGTGAQYFNYKEAPKEMTCFPAEGC